MQNLLNRSVRIAQELQKKISIIIQHSLNDPRIKTMITVSQVKVSRDLSCAQVFVSVLENLNLSKINKLITILNKASGHIRKLLSKKMRLRIVPNIIFYYDDSFLKGSHISMILNNLVKKNENTLFYE